MLKKHAEAKHVYWVTCLQANLASFFAGGTINALCPCYYKLLSFVITSHRVVYFNCE